MRPLLAALVLAAVPAVAQPAAPALAVPFERFQLDNGLDVILHRDASVPVVTVNTWYHVGSGREAPGRTGFAHLFEHLMFEGSGHVPEGAIDTWLEEAGGGANGSTTRDRTNYTTDAAANGLELAIYLDADRMGSLLDAMDAAERGRPARRGQERAAPVDREPALRRRLLRLGPDALPRRPPVPLARHRLDGRPHGGQLRRRGLVLPLVLHAQQRERRRGRRHRPRPRPPARRAVVRVDPARAGAAAPDGRGGPAGPGAPARVGGPRPAPAPLPRVAQPGPLRARRRRRRGAGGRPRRWQDERGCTGGWCTSWRSLRT